MDMRCGRSQVLCDERSYIRGDDWTSNFRVGCTWEELVRHDRSSAPRLSCSYAAIARVCGSSMLLQSSTVDMHDRRRLPKTQGPIRLIHSKTSSVFASFESHPAVRSFSGVEREFFEPLPRELFDFLLPAYLGARKEDRATHPRKVAK